MYELAKSSREKMKAKARRLANPGDYYKDQEVSSADWSPAPPLKTEMKTGARPIMKPSSKGTGESYAARDTKKAIGADMKRGGFKAGGRIKRADGGSSDKKYVNIGGKRVEDTPEAKLAFAKKTFPNITEVGPNAEPIFPKAKSAGGSTKGVKIPSAKETLSTKEIVGANPIKPTRGKAEHYKKGGRTKKADGGPKGSFLERMVGKPKTGSDMSQVGKMGTANYTQEQKGALNRLLNKEDSLPEPAEAAERSGKYQNYKKGGRAERKAGGRTRAKGKTNINIVIAAGRKAGPEMPALDMAAGMPSAPANIPVPMPGAGAPPPAAMPMGGAPGMPSPGILGRKAGGRITKVASSYKDMQAGAGSGEGRLQKTDIAKKHHDAPARKAGGKVYSSYKDMDAGSGSGPGRLEKTEIEKKQRARGK